jgi:CHAD domain-containing protein
MPAFKLNPICPLDAELSRVFRQQLDDAIAAVSHKRESKKERIHKARTACKKARALLKMIRSQNQAEYRRENRRLGDAARRLSALRDADMILDSVVALRAKAQIRMAPAQSDQLVSALRTSRRSTARSSAEIERALNKFRQDIREIMESCKDWSINADFETVCADWRRSYQRARTALRRVETEPKASAFHDWRKASKALYYQCRLLRLAWPPAMKALNKELDELGELLGQEHDLTVLRDSLRRLYRKGLLAVDEDSLAHVLELTRDCRQEMRSKALRVGRRLFVEKPRGLAQRLSRWWQLAEQDTANPVAA